MATKTMTASSFGRMPACRTCNRGIFWNTEIYLDFVVKWCGDDRGHSFFLWTHRQPWVKKRNASSIVSLVTHVPIGPWWLICDLFRFSMRYIPHFCDQTLRDNISECLPSVVYWGESYFQCHYGCVGHMKPRGDIWCFPVKYTLCIVGALHPSG